MKRLSSTLIDFAVIASVGLLCGCAGTAPLKGGKATMTSNPAGAVEQTVVQSDNPAQVSRQDQETVRTRSYTVPTGCTWRIPDYGIGGSACLKIPSWQGAGL